MVSMSRALHIRESRQALSGLMAMAAMAVATPDLHAQTGLLRGVVEDSIGVPIPAVDVSVVGSSRRLRTDSLGRFTLTALGSGTHRLILRRFGFESLASPVTMSDGDTLALTFELRAAPAMLGEVHVDASPITPRLLDVGFDRRRKLEGVPSRQFVTRAEIERRNPVAVSDLLKRMSARASGASCMDPVLFVDGAIRPRLAPPVQMRRLITSRGEDQTPIAGSSANPFRPPVDDIAPGEIEGIEVYTGPAQIPPEFKASGRGFECVVVIWTRGGVGSS